MQASDGERYRAFACEISSSKMEVGLGQRTIVGMPKGVKGSGFACKSLRVNLAQKYSISLMES